MAVSPDRPQFLKESIAEHQIRYQLTSDVGMAAARAFGIAFRLPDETVAQYREMGLDLGSRSGERHHQLPVPAVFLIDRQGRVAFQYANPDFRVRIAPEVLLAAAQALSKQ